MAALRFSLLVAILLGLALLTAPDQASAIDLVGLCSAEMRLCSNRRLRCYECWVHCSNLAKDSSAGLSARSTTWAKECGKFVPHPKAVRY